MYHTIPVFTIRVSAEEKVRLAKRAKNAGISSGAMVRQLLNQQPFVTGADLLDEVNQLLSDPQSAKLRNRRK